MMGLPEEHVRILDYREALPKAEGTVKRVSSKHRHCPTSRKRAVRDRRNTSSWKENEKQTKEGKSRHIWEKQSNQKLGIT